MGVAEILIYGGSFLFGLTLAFAGVLIYEVAVTVLAFVSGFVLGIAGLSSGFVLAPEAMGPLYIFGSSILLGLVSVWAVWALIKWAIMFPGFIAGFFGILLLFRKLLPPLPEKPSTAAATGGLGIFDIVQVLALLGPILVLLYLPVRGLVRGEGATVGIVNHLIGFVRFVLTGIVRPPIAIVVGVVGLEDLSTRMTADDEDIGELWFEFQKNVIGLVLNVLIFIGIPIGVLHYIFGLSQLAQWSEKAIKIVLYALGIYLLGLLRPLVGANMADFIGNIVFLLAIAGGLTGAWVAWRIHQIGIAIVTAFLGGLLVVLAGQMPRILSLVISLNLNRIVDAIEITSLWFYFVAILGVLTQVTLYLEGVTE